MKTKSIIQSTHLIKQANEKLPPAEQSIPKVTGIYQTAVKEVEHDRVFSPEKYMYMSDADLSELIKKKFEEKMADLPGAAPAAEEEKPEENDFASEMDAMAAPEEPDMGGEMGEMGGDVGEMGGGETETETEIEPGADTEGDELDAFFGTSEGGETDEGGEATDTEETGSEGLEGLEGLEGGSDEEPEKTEETPGDTMNKE